jgi:replication factor A1
MTLRLADLRPGMEHLDFRVRVTKLKEIRKIKTYSGLEHSLAEGEVADDSGNVPFTVWNEKIGELEGIKVGDLIEMKNCFITSFKGVIQINVGRDSSIMKVS